MPVVSSSVVVDELEEESDDDSERGLQAKKTVCARAAEAGAGAFAAADGCFGTRQSLFFLEPAAQPSASSRDSG